MFPLEFRPGSPPISHLSYAERSLLWSSPFAIAFLISPWLLGSSTYILVLMLMMLINYIIETNPHCVAHTGLTVTICDYRICHIGLSMIGPHSLYIWMLYHYGVLLSGLGSVALLDEVCHRIFKCSSHAQCVSLFLLLVNPGVQPSILSPVPACCHASCHPDNGLSLWTVTQAPIKCFRL